MEGRRRHTPEDMLSVAEELLARWERMEPAEHTGAEAPAAVDERECLPCLLADSED